MKKLAVLIVMVMSLVVTPVMAGSCEHALTSNQQDTTSLASNHQTPKVASADHSDPSGKGGQTQDAAHMHCCAAHMTAIQSADNGNVNSLSTIKERAIGMWKEARYSSLNVGPLLEPPAHA